MILFCKVSVFRVTESDMVLVDFGTDCCLGVDGSERRLTGLRVTESSDNDFDLSTAFRLLLISFFKVSVFVSLNPTCF